MAERLPTNREVADRLRLIGDLLELEGAVRHRVLAYRRAAARISSATTSVAEMAMAGRAVELPDIGATLQAKIVELVETGDIAALAKLRDRVPVGLAAVARLEGIGPKRATALWEELGVASVDDLAAALADGRVREVPGFGAATEARLAAELARHAAAEADDERVPIGSALPVAEEIARDLRAAVPGARVELAGSLRRGRESVHDIDLVAATDRREELQDALATHPAVERELSRGEAGSSVATHAGVRLELAVGPPEAFGNLLQHATGSAAHNIRLREHAVRRGLSVSQHGILGPDGQRAIHADEEGVYAALGLHLVPPELREDRGEVEAAREGPLPRLVERGDLRGDLHAHTRWSDGTLTVRQMAEAARERGYAYLAISDHSQSLAMAGGLDPERVRRQWEEIDAENARQDDLLVLKATEVDILADGRLDFEDELLAGFDWVTASVHSGFAQDGERYTARLLAAAASPFVDVIGHPTGRMLGRRAHAPVQLAELVEAAAASGTYLEVNAQPRRLDLDAEMARRALAGGAWITIGSDAHSESAFDFIRFGLLVARRAGARPEDVGNTRPWEELAVARRARLAAAGAGQ
ncbi:MAG TPA: DNA polymerase/3'-5' exonuclease PolX [Miltoncostaeaceae bacterium]|nr:DNA polymerase/3'-5' exonuclease PolX [Miltoncostaeaceae bacterium]